MLEETSKNNFQRQQGSARLTILLFFAMIGLLWAGGHKTYTALTNRKPITMSYSDYVQTKPSASWLALTNCELDLPHTCVLKHSDDKNGDRNVYYIPVLDPDVYIPGLNPNAPRQKSYVVYKTTDASICASVKDLNNFKTDEAARAWVRANIARVFPLRNISGLIASEDRSDLERLQKNLADNYIILDADAQPSLAAGIGFSGAGLAMLFGMVVYVRQKRS
jgi:hypothetical protein